MRCALAVLTLALVGGIDMPTAVAAEKDKPAGVLDFEMKSLTGKPIELKQYQGKVVLIVNVASQCGLTPQYEQLQKLYDKYSGKGLAVLGFPANEFGKQEPGTDGEIAQFCQKNYGVTFDMFSKVVVKGDGQCPLYQFLTSKETNPKFPGDIQWNFEKFLVNRQGEVIQRFAPPVRPDAPEVVSAIEAALAK